MTEQQPRTESADWGVAWAEEGVDALRDDLASCSLDMLDIVARWMLAHGWTEPLDSAPRAAAAPEQDEAVPNHASGRSQEPGSGEPSSDDREAAGRSDLKPQTEDGAAEADGVRTAVGDWGSRRGLADEGHKAADRESASPAEGSARTPRTFTGRMLAAFLRGLFPETRQFDRQIADIEDEAASPPPVPAALDDLAAALHAEYHGGGHIDTCLRRDEDVLHARRIRARLSHQSEDA